MNRVPCKGCGRDIVWGKDEKGSRIPLDPRPAVYIVNELLDGTLEARRHVGALVTHFATCPKAADFSRSRTSQTGQDNSTTEA